MFTEDDLLPLSALQHLLFCERQCALIHIEGQWADNRLTVEGRHLHDHVHAGAGQTRAGVRTARALPVRSLRLGLSGVADVVEFHPGGAPSEPHVRPVPIEYKRGKSKRDNCDRVQLCAQAMCLEEMLRCEVPCGALFYGRTRRREDVRFTRDLRDETERAARRLHELVAAGQTPAVPKQPKCRNCSLNDICLPGATQPSRDVGRFMQYAFSPDRTDPPHEDDDP